MRVRILILLCLSILAVVPAIAQTKSVTNADLEKFRQKRLQAEKDYRENYARLGFPSPEELDRQIEKSRVERDQLSARLTAERIARENAEIQRADIARYYEDTHYRYDNSNFNGPDYSSTYPNLIYFGGRRFPAKWPNYNNFPVHSGRGIPVFRQQGPPRAIFIRGPRTPHRPN